jgi:GNAT superfamily N-acetyltransferase
VRDETESLDLSLADNLATQVGLRLISTTEAGLVAFSAVPNTEYYEPCGFITWHVNELVDIQIWFTIGVLPQHRRQGVAKELIRQLESDAYEFTEHLVADKVVVLRAYAMNEACASLLEVLGFSNQSEFYREGVYNKEVTNHARA